MRRLDRRVAALGQVITPRPNRTYLAYTRAVMAFGGRPKWRVGGRVGALARVGEAGAVRAGLTGRVARVWAVVPEVCAACRGWPRVRFLREDEPEPPTSCAACRG